MAPIDWETLETKTECRVLFLAKEVKRGEKVKIGVYRIRLDATGKVPSTKIWWTAAYWGLWEFKNFESRFDTSKPKVQRNQGGCH